MKTFLSFVFCLIALPAFAANPSFQSFYTNHFTTNGFIIKAKLNPTQFDTNSSEISITITNISGITGASDWTNELGTLRPINLELQPMVPSLVIGTNAQAAWGGNLTGGETLVAIRVAESGDQNYNDAFIGTIQTTNDFYASAGFWDMVTSTNFAVQYLGATTNSAFWGITTAVEPDNSTGQAKLSQIWEVGGGFPVAAFYPAIDDTTDSIAWRLGSKEILSVGNIFAAHNAQTNVLLVAPEGGLMVGRNTLAYWGGSLVNGESLISARIADLGDVNNNVFQVATASDTSGNGQTIFSATTATNQAAHNFSHIDTSGNIYSIQQQLYPNDPYTVRQWMVWSNGIVANLEPSVADGAVPYYLRTVATQTITNLFEIANVTTNVFTVAPHGGAMIGPNTPNWYGGILSTGEALVSYNNPDLGDPASANAIITRLEKNDGAASHFQLSQDFTQSNVQFYQQAAGSSASGIFQYASPTEAWLEVQVLGGTMGTLRPARTASAPYVFDTPTYLNSTVPVFSVRNFTTNIVSVGPAAQLNFGAGATNVLYRSGTALRYTNGETANVNFEVYNGAGKEIALNISTGTGALLTTEPLLALVAGAKTVVLDEASPAFRPNSSGVISLGRSDAMWNNVYLTNQIIMGPGLSNLLYRTDEDLTYKNTGSDTPAIHLINSSAADVQFTMTAGGGAVVQAASGQVADLRDPTKGVRYFSSAFTPISSVTLGVLGNPWPGLWLTNEPAVSTNYIYFGTNILSVIATDLYWNGTKLN